MTQRMGKSSRVGISLSDCLRCLDATAERLMRFEGDGEPAYSRGLGENLPMTLHW